MNLYIYTDGAARGNPGPSASGYLIFDAKHKTLAKASFFNGKKTNNFAEYNAALKALKKASEFGTQITIHFFSDSKLMVNQLNGTFKVKNGELKALHAKILDVSKKFDSIEFTHVPRENRYITAVDKALNVLLDSIKNDGGHIVKTGRQHRL